MEFIEHRASDKVKSAMTRAGSLGPMVGGVLGAVPQCGFSAAAANLYTGRVITLGTLIAVFLSTSDEMLPILLAGNMRIGKALIIVAYKCAVGILLGFGIDLAMRLMHRGKEEINIDEICDNDDCHCENGIVRSALHHTLSVSLFVLAVTVLVNALVFLVGDEVLSGSFMSLPVISHLICALVGLIPNCASSVAITQLYLSGVLSAGAMLSGLLVGAGIGILVLLRVNRPIKDSLRVVGILFSVGLVVGVLFDVCGVGRLLGI
jgi:predicted membrane-bound spermidine synthase